MAFLPSITQGTDTMGVSQSNILNNFTILGAIAGNTNPASSSLNINSGFNWVYLPTQLTAIPPGGSSFPAGNVGLYSATNSHTTRNELYINKTGQSGLQQVAATAYNMGGTNAGNGWTYLPSGVLMAWGRSTTGSGTSVAITYASELTNFPGFTTIYAFPQLTRLSGTGPVSNFVVCTSYNQTQFVAQSSLATTGTGIQFSWFVIGI